jgi:TPR repeat protein
MEIRDEALFKDPPPKEDCPICFIPMPENLICCASLPSATISSVLIHDYAIANEELAKKPTEEYYACCGKNICYGCVHSFRVSGNSKCPFCNSDRSSKTLEENNEDLMKRVEANDPASIYIMANSYQHGLNGFQQDHTNAMELYAKSADLGYSEAHSHLGNIYHEGGNMKKAKSHFEAAAMAGHEEARYNVGCIEFNSGNVERAVKHWKIAASAGHHFAMHHSRIAFEKGFVSRETIDLTLTAYNNACAEMRSKARDARIHAMIETI